MKNAGTEIHFKNNKVTMPGQKQNLIITTTGHHAISLRNKQVLEKIRIELKDDNAQISAHCEVCNIYKRPNPRPFIGYWV